MVIRSHKLKKDRQNNFLQNRKKSKKGTPEHYKKKNYRLSNRSTIKTIGIKLGLCERGTSFYVLFKRSLKYTCYKTRNEDYIFVAVYGYPDYTL